MYSSTTLRQELALKVAVLATVYAQVAAAVRGAFGHLPAALLELRRLRELHQLPGDLADLHRRRAAHGANRAIMDAVRMIGGALIMILVITLVLTEVFSAVSINESSPFYGVVTALEGTGVSSMVLLVVGTLVIAASALMRYFNFGGGNGGR